jgi:hypothetical protein
VSSRRSWAALLTLCSALVLAGASASEPPAPALGARPPDAGTPARARDAGLPLLAPGRDGGRELAPLQPEDVEVLENLDLLEHLPESDVLEVLLSVTDE